MKAILFDFDGTLADSIAAIVTSYRNAFEECKVPYPGDDLIAVKIGVGLDVIIKSFVPPEKVDDVIVAYRKHYQAAQRSGLIQFYPDAIEQVLLLREAGFRIGIVTSKLREFTREFLQQNEVDPYFEIIIGSEDVTHKKPHPEPLLTATTELQLSVDECVYVGDTVHDAQSAKAATMPFVGVTTGAGTAKELQEFGPAFSSLTEISAYLLNAYRVT